MKGFKPFPFLALSLCLGAVLMTGCASGHPQNPPGALFITNQTVPDGVVLSKYGPVTLGTAGGMAPFTWMIIGGALPPGLTLSSGGVISGTPPITDLDSSGNAKKYSFTVQVTDSQTPTAAFQKGSFSITINPLLMITTTTVPDGVIGNSYTTTLMNTGGLSPFTWTITSGTLPSGLSLDPSTGIIFGTPADGTAGMYPFTVQVTDADSNTASANLSLTIKGKLQGTFTISFNGYNGETSTAYPFYMVGSFSGLGDGTLTGTIDQNDPVNGFVSAPITGTYDSGSNGLGSLTLNIGAPLNVSYAYDLAVPLNGGLSFILADPNHPKVYGSGVIKAQILSKLPGLTQFAGGYSFGFFGADSAGFRSAGAGSFKTDTPGTTITSGIEDTNDNGTVQSQLSFTGTVTADSDYTTTGRGTMTFNLGSGTQNYVFYVVNSTSEFVALRTDSPSSGAPLSLVSALKQCVGTTGNCIINTATLNANSVMELNGATPTGPDVQLGVSSFDGQGNITLFQTDENNNGTISQNTFTTGTYSVDSNTGRVSVNGLGTNQPVWYLVSSNRGFSIGTDSAATEGVLEPQSGSPFSLPSFLLSYAGGTIQPVSASVTNEVDSTIIPAPGGTVVVTYDSSGPGAEEPLMNQMLASVYTLDPNNGATTGRFILTAVGSPNPTAIVYMITGTASGGMDTSNNKWASINIANPTGAADPNARLTVVQSTH